MAATSSSAGGSAVRPVRRDLVSAALAWAFVVLLLLSEAALTLPDETASDATVASFYAQHRVTIVLLQVVGLVAAGLLAGYAGRLRRFDAVAGTVGVISAALACAPAVVTLVLALAADPAHASAAGTWNGWEPRADDLLFIGVTAFGAVIALRPSFPGLARVLGVIVAALCGARLVLEASAHSRSAFDSLGPISFVLLMACLGLLSAMGRLSPAPQTATGSDPVSTVG
jgi:uncharacterized membrane protein